MIAEALPEAAEGAVLVVHKFGCSVGRGKRLEHADRFEHVIAILLPREGGGAEC